MTIHSKVLQIWLIIILQGGYQYSAVEVVLICWRLLTAFNWVEILISFKWSILIKQLKAFSKSLIKILDQFTEFVQSYIDIYIYNIYIYIYIRHRCGVFIVNSEHSHPIYLMFLLLTMTMILRAVSWFLKFLVWSCWEDFVIVLWSWRQSSFKESWWMGSIWVSISRHSQRVFTCSKSTTEIEQCVKSVQN